MSGLAVKREGEWLLFDCGEGTQTQIARAHLTPNRLSAIFITHLHGDHFNGVSGLLATMGLDRRERHLNLVGPHGMGEYLDMLARLKILFVNYPLELREFKATDLNSTKGSSLSERGEVVYETPLYTVTARALDHRIFALGYRIEERPRPGRFDIEKAHALGIPEGPLFRRLQSGEDVELADKRVIRSSDVVGPPRAGKVIAYCTDTRPCAASIELARDADLLIHEATYTDDMVREADEYGHSTAAQAALVARDAGARKLLITHFSTRYSDVSPLLGEAQEVFPDTVAAEDLAEIEV